MPEKTKSHLRQRMNDKRRWVGDVDRNHFAQAAAVFLGASKIFQEAKHIACYLARTEEFDATPIIRLIWQEQKHCYLPTLAAHQAGALEFVAYEEQDKLHLNRYQILEPANKPVYPSSELDLVIMPLVAFDYEGNRLGAGGGYYDRTFQFLKTSDKKKPVLLGLAYEFQRVKELPEDPWDVPMDGIVTENGVALF